MAATITWTDSIGAGTLTALGGRLNNFTPDVLDIDDAATRLGSGAVDVFQFRERLQYAVELTLVNSDLATANRLVRHLWRGGSVTVNFGDLTTPTPVSHSSMGIGTDRDGGRIAPTLTRADAGTMDYLLALTLQYVGTGSPPTSMPLY